MPEIFYTEREYREMQYGLQEQLLFASKMLARKISRAEVGSGIGGFNCILDLDAESDYCYGCPSTEFCPSPNKRWPK